MTCAACYTAQPSGRGDGRAVGATLFPTTRCQLRCDYCYYYGYSRERPTLDMSDEVAIAAMDFLAERAEREGAKIVSVGWFGAEPLLRLPFIEWFMLEARKRHPGLKWTASVTTNGVAIASREVAERMRMFESVIISVDGVGPWHDKHRKFPDGRGSWFLVERAIRNLVELGIPFTARMTLTPENVDGAFECVRHLVEMGATRIFTGIVEEDVWDAASLWKLREQYQRIADYLIGKLLEGVRIEWGQFRHGVDLLLIDRPRGENEHCGQLGNSMAIYVDGRVYACHRAAGIPEFWAGDVFRGLDPEKAEKLSKMFSRSRAIRESGLEDYPFRHRSYFGCLMSNYEARGDVHRANREILKAYEESCALAAAKLLAVGRLHQSELIYSVYFKGVLD